MEIGKLSVVFNLTEGKFKNHREQKGVSLLAKETKQIETKFKFAKQDGRGALLVC